MIIKFNKSTKITLLILILGIALNFAGLKVMEYNINGNTATVPATGGEAAWLAYAIPWSTIALLFMIVAYLVSKNINKRTAVLIIIISVFFTAFSLIICSIGISS